MINIKNDTVLIKLNVVSLLDEFASNVVWNVQLKLVTTWKEDTSG